MRVSHIRAAPENDILAYRLALSLHVRFSLDAEYRDVDLRNLSRSETREMLAGIERRTGLSTGALVYDAMPELDADE